TGDEGAPGARPTPEGAGQGTHPRAASRLVALHLLREPESGLPRDGDVDRRAEQRGVGTVLGLRPAVRPTRRGAVMSEENEDVLYEATVAANLTALFNEAREEAVRDGGA